MYDNGVVKTDQPRQAPTVVLRIAGAGYGAFFGLGLALFVWGYDGLVLSRASADFAWGLLMLGLPCALLIGGATGYLGILLSGVGWTALLWAASLGALTWIAGHIPFEGFDFIASVVNPRFARLTLRPYLEANEVRMILALIPNVLLGFAVGYLETRASDAAWDYTDARGRMGLRSWCALMLGLLVAVVPAVIIHVLIMQPIRAPQLQVARLVATTLQGGVEAVEATGQNRIEAKNYGQRFTPHYTVQFAEFATITEDLYTSYVTVAFDTGFALQCVVMGERVTFCEDITKKFETRIGDMVHAGLTGEQRWRDDPTRTFVVEGAVVEWLRNQQERLSERYAITRTERKGPVTLIEVQFDTGFTMTCRFSGAAVTRVVTCSP